MTIYVKVQEEEPSFDELLELVGMFFTLITVETDEIGQALMYMNEEGDLHSYRNDEASEIAGFDVFGDVVLWIREGSPVI
jgi:hypothetical protein